MEHVRPGDEFLMAEVASGDRESLTVLLRRYANPLLTFIQRMVGDRHRSEELFQEVFLAVWTSRRTYRFPRSFPAWLYGIARRKCWHYFRRPRLEVVGLPEDGVAAPVSAGPTPAETAIATETAALVAQALVQLPARQRMVVVLRVWNDLSYAEIAEAIGRSEATARSHMFHALQSVRRYLEPRLR